MAKKEKYESKVASMKDLIQLLVLGLPSLIIRFLKETSPFSYILSFILRLPFLKKLVTEQSCFSNMLSLRLEKVSFRSKVREMFLYNYPRTDELGFLDLLLGRLEELLERQPKLNEILKTQVKSLYVEFDFLRSFLRKIKEQRDEHEELRALWTRVIRLAYEAEHVIDLYLVKSISFLRIMLSLVQILEQTKLIKSEVTRIHEEDKYLTEARGVQKTYGSLPSHATETANDQVVGFEDEAEKIMEFLIGDSKQLDVISIVGMPGLGKTTLATKLYEAPLVVQHFDIRAWCVVSQNYRKRELLISILSNIMTATEEINRLNDEELAAMLYRSLKGRRYFIVIDDLWDIKDWYDLVRPLPEDNICSRILITSRLLNVASQTKAGCKVHALRQLSDDESWELFEKKVFQKESFSHEFWYVGQQILKNCNRLPLAIVVIAGLLAKVEKKVYEWSKIVESLSSHIFSDSQSHCKALLELSYNHLPNHLKSCFLYFGAFSKDEEILVQKIKLLWIAEGFVQDVEGKSLEDVAEEYFMDLIGRSLVTATKKRSYGGVKTCRIHDLLHNFCLEKAKEESFMQVKHTAHGNDFRGRRDQRRLSIYCEVYHLMEAKPYGFGVRSLLHTALWEDSYPRGVSFMFRNFKLLRVLDLVFINIGESFSGIELLIHLKYLAIRAETTSIPSSIANLLNLQFFFIKLSRYYRYGGEVVNVPDSLWDMVNLRHMHILNRSAAFDVKASRLENSLLDNLESLSTPRLSYGEDAENLLRRLPKLRKLRCVFMYCWDDNMNGYRFPALDFLGQLMSLKVFFEGASRWGKRFELNFPSDLQKLTLSNFRLSWGDISIIGRMLHNLKVLKLIGDDWDNKWNMNDGDFPKLKYLKLSRLIHLREWIASEDSFPILEQLVLDYCWNLKEIPPCFGEIPTLRMITVRDCKSSVDKSARIIQKEQKDDWQNKELKVYIYPRK